MAFVDLGAKQAQNTASAALAAAESLKPVITVITYNQAAVTLADNTEYRCTSTALQSLSITLPNVETDTELVSSVVYKHVSGLNYTVPLNVTYSGIDCDEGTFLPQNEGYVYDITFWYNGFVWKAVVA